MKANQSPEPFERCEKSLVLQCRTERPNAWETHESTEPIMKCAKCIRQLKKLVGQRDAAPDYGQHGARLDIRWPSAKTPAWLGFGR